MFFIFFLQGCASILKLDEKSLHVKIDKKFENLCMSGKKMIWKQITLGREFIEYEDSYKSSYKKKEISIVNKELGSFFKNENCKNYYLVVIVISNYPYSESRVLVLLNAISFGIIPYWDVYGNTLQ